MRRNKLASTGSEQPLTCKEGLKQRLQAKAQRIRRYIKRSEQYRELGKKTIMVDTAPNLEEFKKF